MAREPSAGHTGCKQARLKVLTVFGTRPEAIKLFPLLHRLERDPRFVSRVCVSGQHRGMLEQALELMGIAPDHDLRLMREGQCLNIFTSRLLAAIDPILQAESPDLVLVQGDTGTAFGTAMAAHYRRIPVAHVEAGLRSGNLDQPWPEEFNRKAIAALAQYHFAPTARAREDLLTENVPAVRIRVTGNTVIDALYWMRDRLRREPQLAGAAGELEKLAAGRRIIGVTCHRRENLEDGIARIAAALRAIAARKDVLIAFPLHPNPQVSGPMRAALEGRAGIHLMEPLGYPDFIRLVDMSHFMLSDSGGVQEEAPALGTPVLVMRETTERPEGIAAGNARLVGTDPARIVTEASRLLDDTGAHRSMANARNPYGDGRAAERIVQVLARDRISHSIRQIS